MAAKLGKMLIRVQRPHQLSRDLLQIISWCNITTNDLLRLTVFLKTDTISCKRKKRVIVEVA